MKLTREERAALCMLEELSKIWPQSLTLVVGSSSETLHVIRTPETGSAAEDNLHLAEDVAHLAFPVGACS